MHSDVPKPYARAVPAHVEYQTETFGAPRGTHSSAALVSSGRMASTRSLFLRSVHVPRDWDDVRETETSIVRARIFEAMAQVVGERGYAAATIADVVRAASISRRTFYEHFKDKEDCFVQTYRTGCENGIAEIGAALRELEEPDWQTRLVTSLETYVSVLAAEPHFARVLLIEVLAAGPSALAMRERILAVYVEHYRGLQALAREEDPSLPELPDAFLRGLVGGIAELVQQCLLESPDGEVPERLLALTPTLAGFAGRVLGSDAG
jgi:AcrR family transcriptional regulator